MRDAIADVDAVLIATWRPEVIEAVAGTLRPLLDHRPLLVAGPTADQGATAITPDVLAYPLQADELSDRLAELNASPTMSRDEV